MELNYILADGLNFQFIINLFFNDSQDQVQGFKKGHLTCFV